MNINVAVTDANNIVCEVTPTPTQVITIDRGVVGNGIASISVVMIDGDEYLHIVFTNGTSSDVGPISATYYTGTSPINVNNTTNVISLDVVPITLGGTNATTAPAAIQNLLPTYTGNANKRLGLNSGATGLEWVTDGGGTVTSVNASGGTTGLSFSGGPITSSGTLTMAGTLAVANGGTGGTTATDARTNLNAASQSTTITAGTGLSGGGDLSANRTINLANTTVTAGSFGSASNTLTATVNAQGQLTALAATPIAIANTQVSGLGTMSTQNASSVAITGGSITGITDLAVADGGTGASDASGARTNLGAAASATTITAGTGLTGGGDLSANRTIAIANTAVTAGAYGSASNTLTATVNAQGQLTALAATPIAIANTQVSGLGTMSTQNSNNVTISGGSITGITDLAIADGGTGASTAADARSNLGLGTAAVLNAGVALGVATLDAGGTVPLSQIPASIQGGVSYQGSWNAATNTPTLTSSVGSKGYYYVVSTSGSTNLNGITDWLVGDWAIFNGSVWQKIDNTDSVASVNGYTGAVVLTNTDVGAPSTSLTISAGTGLTGGGDLTTNRTLSIANTTVAAASYGTASAVPTFTVNGQGQLTAASNTTIAIANTQVSGLGTMSTQNANSVAITGGSVNGTTVGASTASTGAFTTLTASGLISSTAGNNTNIFLSSGATTGYQFMRVNNTSGDMLLGVEGATPALIGDSIAYDTVVRGTTGISFSANNGSSKQMRLSSAGLAITGTLSASGAITNTAGTANGVTYLNGSKVLTSGSALTFDGTSIFAAPRVRLNNANRLDWGTGSEYVVGDNGGAMLFGVASAEQMRLTATGLGIGTSSPAQKLEVSGSRYIPASGWTSVMSVRSTDSQAANVGAGITLGGVFTGTSQTDFAQIAGLKEDGTAGNYGGVLTLYTRPNGGGLTERVRIDASGNVGISTNSPVVKLQVDGTFGVSSGGTYTGSLFTNSSAFDLQAGSNSTNGLRLGSTISAPIIFYTNGTEKARFNASGQLGVGITSPAATIHVNGGDGTSGNEYNSFYVSNPANSAKRVAIAFDTTNDVGIITAVHAGTAWKSLALAPIGGNVGVGTVSPAAKLHVVGNVRSSNGAGTIYTSLASDGVYAGGTDLYLLAPTGYSLIFYTNNTEKFRFGTAGQLGIGGANYGTSGQVLTSQGSGSPPIWAAGGGGSSQWTTSGSDIYYNTGNIAVGSSTTTTGRISAIATTQSAFYGTADAGYAIFDGATNASGSRINISAANSTDGIIIWGYNSGRTGYTPLRYGASQHQWLIASTEQMRLDAAGRLGIATTAQTTNLAKLQVNHDPSNDRYGIYVPGNAYVGSGPSGNQYGGYFVPHVSNSVGSGTQIGVYGSANNSAIGSAQYGGYFDGKGAASTPCHGVYATARQSDNNGPGTAYGGFFNVNTVGSGAGGSGGMIAVRAENTSSQGGTSMGVWSSTTSGPTNIYGYYYEHAGSLQFRVKSNGGIDNYSGNNSNLSDRREKTDFVPAKSYLDVICSIPVQTFKYINQEDELPTLGVVAQDVQAVAPELVSESNWGSNDEPKMRLSIYQTDLQYALMKALQELKAEFDAYKASHP